MFNLAFVTKPFLLVLENEKIYEKRNGVYFPLFVKPHSHSKELKNSISIGINA